MFNSNKQIKMVGLQGNTLHCSKSESLSSLGFFVIDAASFAAAALGVLEAAIVTIGEESESEDSLSSLPKLDSESESFFFLVLDAFLGFFLRALEAAEATIGEESETEEDNNDLTLAWCASFFEACLPYEPTKYFVPQTRHV